MPANDSLDLLMPKAEEAASLCRACGNSRRLMLLCHLTQHGRLNVGEIGRLMPDISQSAISQHLSVLKDEGLIAADKESQLSYYHISNPSAGRLLSLLKEIFCP